MLKGDSMVRSGARLCDICGFEIPAGEPYRKASLPAEAAALLLDTPDIELAPTLTQEPSGAVTLDLCLECHLSMGDAPSAQA